jgi:hypothetical protein
MGCLPPLADLASLRDRISGGIDSDDEPRAVAALEDASTDVRDASGQDWVNPDGTLMTALPEVLVRITRAVAKREFLNPDGLASETETEGPYSRSVTRAASKNGSLLTDEEQAVCQRYRPAGKRPLWTLPTTRADRCDTTVWVDDQYGAEPFPLYEIGERGGDVWIGP